MILKKHCLAWLFLIGINATTFSQNSTALSINLGGNPGRTNLPFFKDYAEAYNTGLSNELQSGIGNMRWSYGYSFGMTLVMNALYLEFENERSFTGTKAIMNDPAVGDRYFKAKHVTKSLIVGYTQEVGGGDFLTGGYILGFRTIYIDSYRKYPNGDLSFGDENFTNGKYEGRNFTMGLKIEYNASITDRLYAFFGMKLTFSLPYFLEFRIREMNADNPLRFPGMVWDDGLPSIHRSGLFTFGFRFMLFNNL